MSANRYVVLGLGVLSWTGVVACSEVTNGRWMHTVADSAGVRIYDNHYTSHPVHWTNLASLENIVNMDVPDGGEPFFRIRGIALLDNDRMAIAEEHSVSIVTLSGRVVGSAGGDGEGPSGFRDIVGIVRLAGDSILVLDGELMRLSVFDSAARLVGTTRIEMQGQERLWGLHLAGDGTVVVGTLWSGLMLGSDRSPGRKRLPYRAFRYGRTGELSDVLGPFPGPEVVVGRTGGRLSIGIAPFARQTTIGVSGQLLYLGTADQFEIIVRRLDGGKVATIRVGPIDLRIDQADIEDWIKDRADQLPSSEAAAAFRRVMARAEGPEQRPAFSELLVSDAGDLWIKEFTQGSFGEVLWHIVSGRNGRYCGSVSLPTAFWLVDVRASRVAGIWKDEMEVEYVRVYEFDGDRLEACRSSSE